MRTVCRVALFAKPAFLAALWAAPATGVTNTTPVPGRSGARRAMTNSRFALPSASVRSFPPRPPGRSSMVAAHVSTRVTLSAMASSSGLGWSVAQAAGRHAPVRIDDVQTARQHLHKTLRDHSVGVLHRKGQPIPRKGAADPEYEAVLADCLRGRGRARTRAS